MDNDALATVAAHKRCQDDNLALGTLKYGIAFMRHRAEFRERLRDEADLNWARGQLTAR